MNENVRPLKYLKFKKTIYSMNYLENKINFSERTDAMKIKINGSILVM